MDEDQVDGQETQNEEQVATGEPTETAVEPEGDATPPEPKVKPWVQKRIDELTRQRYDADRAAEAAKAEAAQWQHQLEELKKTGGLQDDGRRKYTDAEVKMLAQSEAQRLAGEKAYTDLCNDIWHKGNEEIKGFAESIKNFSNLGVLPASIVEAAAETGIPHKVLHALGQDLDEASRIWEMSPARQAAAIVKLAGKLTEAPTVSKAPPPIKPVRGTAAPQFDPDSETTSYADWLAWRNKELAAKKRA